jgi:pyridoxal phosphate enzyme (YggS family)
MTRIAERTEAVKNAIKQACARSGRDPTAVKLVIVTKSASFEQVLEVIRLGFRELAENRVQQLKRVAADTDEHLKSSPQSRRGRINWHMIGHLQRNKVRQVLPLVSMIHSVDTLRLAEEINSAAGKMGLRPDVLLQVNTSREPQKYGVPVGAAVHLAEQIATLPHLRLKGLMTMAPLTKNEDTIRSCFVRARELFVEISAQEVAGRDFTELSMGMSSDYELAVEEGATILRIGSALFAG